MAFYDSLKLEKGMYNKDFTSALESIDPSENYINTNLSGLDAYERQLKRFNIKVKGKNSDNIEAFFKTSDSAVLFPEYVKRSVLQGMNSANVLPSIVATVTKIDGNDYRTIKTTIGTDNSTTGISEGTALTSTTITNQDELVTLKKRGNVISASYESLRLKRLDLFSVTLRQIGAQIARTQLSDAVSILVNGDGNNNAAAAVNPVSTTGLAYADLIALWASFDKYELNTILANTKTMQVLLSLNEMKDAEAGLNFQGTGQMITPLGATLLRADSVADNTLIGIDRNCALEMVQAGDVLIDSDKLIDKQLERISISCTAGFAKIYKDATKKMTYTKAS